MLWYILGGAVVLFFAIWGVTDFICWVKKQIICQRGVYYNYILVPLKGHVGDLELLARSIAFEALGCRATDAGVIFVEEGMDTESRKICFNFCKENSIFVLCDRQSLYRVVENRIMFAETR